MSLLRDLRDDDVDAVFELWTDPVAVAMTSEAPCPSDRAEFDAFWLRMLDDETQIWRVIERDGDLVGTIYSREHFSNREVDVWIDRAYWGQGLATRALAEFLDVDRGRPMFAETPAANAGARRVLEKHGFRLEQTGTSFVGPGDEDVAILLYKLR